MQFPAINSEQDPIIFFIWLMAISCKEASLSDCLEFIKQMSTVGDIDKLHRIYYTNVTSRIYWQDDGRGLFYCALLLRKNLMDLEPQ